MGRRKMVFPRGLRTGAGAQPRMVQRPGITCDADAYQGVRRLQRTGRGGAQDFKLHRNQPDRQLRRDRPHGFLRGGRGRESREGSQGGLQDIQLCGVLQRGDEIHRRQRSHLPHSRQGRHDGVGINGRQIRIQEGFLRQGQESDHQARPHRRPDRQRSGMPRLLRHRAAAREAQPALRFKGTAGEEQRALRP